ncbi:YciI family protein [Pseudonocardia sp. CA-107938]|uniref:YciI family protein n=1 Tax=Pseudonocardia sp. CA-107938 TaxID=3240021 RepID=UPI003D93275A
MEYLLSVQVDESAPPPAEGTRRATYERGVRVNSAMQSAGVWVFGGRLQRTHSATVVHAQNGTTAMTDGPFAETKEQLAGIWVIRVPDLDAALTWAQRCAEAVGGPVEVRPFDATSQD